MMVISMPLLLDDRTGGILVGIRTSPYLLTEDMTSILKKRSITTQRQVAEALGLWN